MNGTMVVMDRTPARNRHFLVTTVVAIVLISISMVTLLVRFMGADEPEPTTPEPSESASVGASATPSATPSPTSLASGPTHEPTLDPSMLLEFEEFDRTSLVTLPAVVVPEEHSTTLVEMDTGLGLSISVPEWLTPLGNQGNYMPFAAHGAWLTVERYTMDEPDDRRTIDSVLNGMLHYEEIEVTGDDTDFQITSRDVRDNHLRHERIINGASDALVIRWWSPWEDEALKELARQVVGSAAPTRSLDEPHPMTEDAPAADPMVDPLGHYSVPLPPDFTEVAHTRTETLLRHPQNIFWSVSIRYVATEERLTLDEAMSQDTGIPYVPVNSGGDEDEFWWNGTVSGFTGYRHYLVGDAGYVAITALIDVDEPEQRDAIEANLRFVLENITIAPLD